MAAMCSNVGLDEQPQRQFLEEGEPSGVGDRFVEGMPITRGIITGFRGAAGEDPGRVMGMGDAPSHTDVNLIDRTRAGHFIEHVEAPGKGGAIVAAVPQKNVKGDGSQGWYLTEIEVAWEPMFRKAGDVGTGEKKKLKNISPCFGVMSSVIGRRDRIEMESLQVWAGCDKGRGEFKDGLKHESGNGR
ncbi:hypothetical protein M413DRAFT_7667 [Hebeloma cylindrosporum]|uniref:Uncharacterized protein n=1 Tax=Hebeloma cylindrosporum TaxID=76867 RepID=A0A0C3CSX3_HEBCY|nr:hypothetical protein M413DRAFT_7667 [Hebeloma cylindrosporum h7]